MASVTSKLRDSCNACAVSKIKCPKEKPKCSRCESRGVDCHYSFTRRPGRRPENGNGNGSSRRLSAAASSDPLSAGGKVRSLDSLSSINHHSSKRSGSSTGSGSGSVSGTASNSSTSTSINLNDLPRPQLRHDILDSLFWTDSANASPMTTPATGCSINGTPNNTPGVDSVVSISSYFDIPLTSPTTTTASIKPSGLSTSSSDDVHPCTTQMDTTADSVSLLGDALEMHPFPDFDGFDHRMEEFIDPSLDTHFAVPTPTPGAGDDSSNITPKPADIAALLIPNANVSVDWASLGHGLPGLSGDATNPGSISPSLFAWPDPNFGSSSASTLSILSSAMSSSPSQLQQLSVFGDNSTSSVCHLAQSLEILKKLSSAQSSQPASFSGEKAADAFTKLVLGENQQSIDAVGAILSSSSCGSDSFLLAILSMTVLKILERYDAAAKAGDDFLDWLDPGFSSHLRDSHLQSLSMSSSSSSQGQEQHHRRSLSHGHDSGARETAAAKLVLGELHRVQRLVNEVSRESEKHRENAASDRDLVMRDSTLSSGMASPRPLVTTSTLAQLEIDMRKNLNALSTGIIDRLRAR